MFTLLPKDTRAEVESEYRKRVLAVAFGLTALAMLAGAIGAVPAYVNIRINDQTARAKAAVAVTNDTQTVSTLEKQVKDIGVKIAALKDANSQKTLISIMDLIGERITPGISISNISLKRTDTGSITLAGTAATRDALVTFSKSLQGEPSFSGISLPISSLAKSRDISFSISINSHF
jgi:Tfp pilus assembly protein PilN